MTRPRRHSRQLGHAVAGQHVPGLLDRLVELGLCDLQSVGEESKVTSPRRAADSRRMLPDPGAS